MPVLTPTLQIYTSVICYTVEKWWGGKKKKKRQLQNNVSRTVAQTRFVELRRVRISYGKALLYSLHYSAVEFSTLIGHCNIIALY